jgi:hypothetical protein
MDPVIYIAKIAAVLYLSVGISALLNKNYLKKVVEDYVKSPGLAYLGAVSALVLGFILLFIYSEWVWDWKLLITLLGWGAIIKGVFALLFPGALIKLSESLIKMKSLFVLCGVVGIILGLFFGYYGFMA